MSYYRGSSHLNLWVLRSIYSSSWEHCAMHQMLIQFIYCILGYSIPAKQGLVPKVLP